MLVGTITRCVVAVVAFVVVFAVRDALFRHSLSRASVNSTSLVEEMKALEDSARDAEARANSSEAKV